MSKASRYSPEFRQRAVHLFHEQEVPHPSKWAALNAIAGKVGCTAETLRKWVKQHEIDQGQREGLSTSERDRLKELERENRELKQANEILRKASAFSPRRSSTADRRNDCLYRRAARKPRGRASL